MTDPPPTFQSPVALAVSVTLLAIAVVMAVRRRVALPPVARWLAAVGLGLLALAAGGPTWPRPAAGEVAVMVDLSPSTRGAGYRDRAVLARRVAELLGNTPYRLYPFAGGPPAAESAPPGSPPAVPYADLPADQTVFAPPPGAAAVLLFSDGQFAPPFDAPPTFAVVDENLLVAADAGVTALRLDGTAAAAEVAVASAGRTLSWAGADGPAADTVEAGTYVVHRPLSPVPAGAAMRPAVTARLSPGDAWPENDALTVRPPPPDRLERWWVAAGGRRVPGPTAGPPPAGFRVLTPAELPTDPAAYLSVAVVVLDNVPADAEPPAARETLARYVRGLGGGLVIAGGDRAFAAGGYVGTVLDALSPLASSPPRPTAHWLLLTDGSGSMSAVAAPQPGGGPAAGGSRWQAAADALLRLLTALPPDDQVDVGSFAEALTWWSAGRPARATIGLPLPPAGVEPRGPTNLRPAIEAAVAALPRVPDAPSASGTPPVGAAGTPPSGAPPVPVHLLLLSDADADVGDVPSLVALLRGRNVRLHLLAVDAGRGLGDLQAVSRQTGGRTVRQDDAAGWAAAAADLLRSAAGTRLGIEPTTVTYASRLAALPGRAVSPWNQTWLKPRATELARGTGRPASGPTVRTPDGGAAEETPTAMAADWQVGEGRVAAVAFSPTAAEVAAVVDLVARPPRDPRVNVVWDVGRAVSVRVDVVDPDPAATEPYGNGLTVSLEVAADASPAEGVPLRQTGPGRYEGEVPAPASPALATVRLAGRAVAREAVAGRYAAEFDAIGVNRDVLTRLADRTGGRVIEPAEHRPIEFRWPRRDVPLTPWVAAAGAGLLLAALLVWRQS